ncbi:MAG: hypothetical protein ABIS67_13905 [Candidatus Eisenbacteria bacterium]
MAAGTFVFARPGSTLTVMVLLALLHTSAPGAAAPAAPVRTAVPIPGRHASDPPPLSGAPLDRAARLYEREQYAEAVDLLRGAMTEGTLTGPDVERAKVLVARCMIRQGSERVGREILKGVLRRDPDYRPAAGVMTADESRVFAEALHDRAEERAVEAAQKARQEWREPASLSFAAGIRNRSDEDIQSLFSKNGDQQLDDRIEWTGAVRIPSGSRFSFQFEVISLEQKARLTYPFLSFDARVRAVPVVASLYWRWSREDGGATQLFVGGGPMVSGELELTPRDAGSTGTLLARETGTYAHLGMERDVLLARRLGLSLRALGRVSRTRGLDLGPTFGAPGALDVNGRTISFSGFAVQAALRAYIGS